MTRDLPIAVALTLALYACGPGAPAPGSDASGTPSVAANTGGVPAAPGSPTATDIPTAPDAAPAARPETRAADADGAEDTCGADKVAARWLNALPTAEVKAAIAKAVGERPIRYYGQGDVITMDFSPQRLNVELGEDGRIKLFRCG